MRIKLILLGHATASCVVESEEIEQQIYTSERNIKAYKGIRASVLLRLPNVTKEFTQAFYHNTISSTINSTAHYMNEQQKALGS